MVNKEGIIIMNILEEIAEKTEERIKREMRCKPLEELEKEKKKKKNKPSD